MIVALFFLAQIFEENWWEDCAQTVCTHAFDAFVTVLAPAFAVHIIRCFLIDTLQRKSTLFQMEGLHTSPPSILHCQERTDQDIWLSCDPWQTGRVEPTQMWRKTTQRLERVGEKIEGILQKKEHIQIHHNQMLKKKNWIFAAYRFFSQDFGMVGEPESIDAFDVPPPQKKHVQWILRPEEEASWILSRSYVDVVELWITTSFLLRSYSTFYLLSWVVRVTGCHWQSSHEWEDLATKPQLWVWP